MQNTLNNSLFKIINIKKNKIMLFFQKIHQYSVYVCVYSKAKDLCSKKEQRTTKQQRNS